MLERDKFVLKVATTCPKTGKMDVFGQVVATFSTNLSHKVLNFLSLTILVLRVKAGYWPFLKNLRIALQPLVLVLHESEEKQK